MGVTRSWSVRTRSTRTRSNRAFCQQHAIRVSGPRLGRPKNNPELEAAEKKQFIDDQRQRNAVEGKFGECKRRYGLGLIRKKPIATQGSSIAMNILVMTLQKLLRLLFVFIALWWQLLIAAAKTQQANRELFPYQLNGMWQSCDGFLVEAILFTSLQVSLSQEVLYRYHCHDGKSMLESFLFPNFSALTSSTSSRP